MTRSGGRQISELEMAGVDSREAAVILEYGIQPKRRVGYKIGLWMLGLALVAGSVWLAILLATDIAEKFRHDRVRRECENYSRPATQVVVETDEKAWAVLKQSHPDYSICTAKKVSGSGPSGHEPTFLGQLPACVSGLGHTPEGATVFLHNMRGDDGVTKLVLLEVTAGHDLFPGMHLKSFVFSPADLKSKASISRVSRRSDGGFVLVEINETDRLQMFAGQVDPADPSHFIVVYSLNGKRGEIHGWLRAGAGVVLRLRDQTDWLGPVGGPATSSTRERDIADPFRWQRHQPEER